MVPSRIRSSGRGLRVALGSSQVGTGGGRWRGRRVHVKGRGRRSRPQGSHSRFRDKIMTLERPPWPCVEHGRRGPVRDESGASWKDRAARRPQGAALGGGPAEGRGWAAATGGRHRLLPWARGGDLGSPSRVLRCHGDACDVTQVWSAGPSFFTQGRSLWAQNEHAIQKVGAVTVCALRTRPLHSDAALHEHYPGRASHERLPLAPA